MEGRLHSPLGEEECDSIQQSDSAHLCLPSWPKPRRTLSAGRCRLSSLEIPPDPSIGVVLPGLFTTTSWRGRVIIRVESVMSTRPSSSPLLALRLRYPVPHRPDPRSEIVLQIRSPRGWTARPDKCSTPFSFELDDAPASRFLKSAPGQPCRPTDGMQFTKTCEAARCTQKPTRTGRSIGRQT